MDSRLRGNDNKGRVSNAHADETRDLRARCAPYIHVNQTVATGVAGEPIAPGNLSGGAVSKNRLR